MKQRVYLVDGSALAYRSYFAFAGRPLVNSKGENTGAAFGVANTLLKLLREERPDYMAVVFDSREPTFRHVKYAQYKANREKMPDDMQAQFPRILELVEALGLKILQVSGFEADDVMGTLARRFASEKMDVILVSADKDFCQLVSECVKLLNPGRSGEVKKWVGASDVEARFGVGPRLVVDVLALMGDSSDNIPGVPGIGPKTASRLVSTYGSLEEMLGKLPITEEPRVSEKLSRFAEQARLSRELASIDLNVPIPLDLEDLRPGERRNDKLKALLEELEFKKLSSTIFGTQEIRLDWKELQKARDFDELLQKTRKWDTLGLAFASRRQRFSPPLGLAVASPEGEGFYFRVGEDGGPARKGPKGSRPQTSLEELFPAEKAPNGLSVAAGTPSHSEAEARETGGSPYETTASHKDCLPALRKLFSDPDDVVAVHDLKSALGSLSSLRIPLGAAAFDVMMAGYLIDPAMDVSLAGLAARFLGVELGSLESLPGVSKAGRVWPEEVPPQALGEYVSRCALTAAAMRVPLQSSLNEMGLSHLYERVELPLARILHEMECTGVAVDVEFLREMSSRLEAQIADAEKEIFKLAGCTFNLNSPAQLSKVLFEDLKLPAVRKTRGKGAPSTDERVLEELAAHSEVPAKIIKYRQLYKLRNTYVEVFPRMLSASTGRLHANFNQAVAATGRLSMSEPNLQNIPARSEVGREIRKAIVAGRQGWALLSGDYSQVELRLLAHCSGDERLTEAFRKGADIHASTASSLFGVSPGSVPAELRAKAKVVNFGIIYGMGAYGLSRQLGITTAEARSFINEYYDLYPGVARYVRDVVEEARDRGYARTLLGRRRPIPGLASQSPRVRGEAERMAINTPIQGSAADMIKLAMIGVHRRIKEKGLAGRLILQVHDELLLELPQEEVEALTEVVRHEMEHAMELDVPVTVEIGTGRNWYETH